MQGFVSFHPVDLSFYDDLIQPLLSGEKVNPEGWLDAAVRMWLSDAYAARCVQILEELLEQIEPPPPPPGLTTWGKIKHRLERFDFRPPVASVLAARSLDPELHLTGRPFFIAEESAERVSTMVDEFRGAGGESEIQSLLLEQLIRLSPELPKHLELDRPEVGNPNSYRTLLLNELKAVFDLGQAARSDQQWSTKAGGRDAREIVRHELAWRTLTLHSRAVPYWIAEDVDGLEVICGAAGVPTPDSLVPAWRLFGAACEDFPELQESLGTALERSDQVGAFVAPDDVPELRAFLNSHGASIIKIAGEHGEGARVATLLRKIRECLRYAELHGMGYLEAAGLPILSR